SRRLLARPQADDACLRSVPFQCSRTPRFGKATTALAWRQALAYFGGASSVPFPKVSPSRFCPWRAFLVGLGGLLRMAEGAFGPLPQLLGAGGPEPWQQIFTQNQRARADLQKFQSASLHLAIDDGAAAIRDPDRLIEAIG